MAVTSKFKRFVLNEFESTAEVDDRIEKLNQREFEILAQLLRYPEQLLSRESLKRVAGFDDGSISDRKLDSWLVALIRKTNVLCPEFPVVRFMEPDSYTYTEQPPKKKEDDS